MTPATPSRGIITGRILTSGTTNGIKVSKDVGTSKAIAGYGKAPKVISGTKDSGDTGTRSMATGNGAAIKAINGTKDVRGTGTRNVTVGNGVAIEVMSIRGAVMAGNGAESDKDTIGIVSDR